ncbi:hypothetical protein [Streptomyces sp. NPDC017448]|uniref:hypothetical protein n=1 Tax=Streptomyces sp. NPDC017448 TaxID=3364996 RepID=UPI00379920FB
MLSTADGAAGRTENPEDRADDDENSTDRRQERHTDEQSDDEEKKSKENHAKSHRRVRVGA